MSEKGKNHLLPGADKAIEIAERIEARRRLVGVSQEAMARHLGLENKTQWSKRVRTGKADWVPFRVNEVEALIPLLGKREPGWPYLSDEEARRLWRSLAAAEAHAEYGGASPPPVAASPSTAKPTRQTQGGGRTH